MPPAKIRASTQAHTIAMKCKSLLPAALLACLFFLLYQTTGRKLADTPIYDRNDVFFRTDTHRAQKDMTGDRLGMRGRTSVHPIFVITHQPVGVALTELIRRTGHVRKYEAVKKACVIMTAAAGAGVVVLFFYTLSAMGLAKWRSFLFATLLGCSSTQMFFASVPETYIFSSLGLAAVAFVGTRRQLGESWWQAGAVYAAGNLTANLAPVGIWCLCRHWRDRSKLCSWLGRVSLSMLATLAVLATISLIQKWLYPQSSLFFLPSSVTNEGGWLYWENILETPGRTCRILLQHLWVSNILGPAPTLQLFNGQPMASIEAGEWNSFQAAWPLYALWAAMLAGAATSLARKELWTRSFVAAFFCLSFNFVFHSVFGNDRMLYSADWTVYTVLALAWGLEIMSRHAPWTSTLLNWGTAIFVMAEALHNFQFLEACKRLVLASGS